MTWRRRRDRPRRHRGRVPQQGEQPLAGPSLGLAAAGLSCAGHAVGKEWGDEMRYYCMHTTGPREDTKPILLNPLNGAAFWACRSCLLHALGASSKMSEAKKAILDDVRDSSTFTQNALDELELILGERFGIKNSLQIGLDEEALER